MHQLQGHSITYRIVVGPQQGRKVRYQLKTPYRDGTTHDIFEPFDFMAKLAALVPKPRANPTRYHGVLAPNNKHRIHVTPARRDKGNTQKQGAKAYEPALVDCHQNMMRIPDQVCTPFQTKPATHSTRKLPPIPVKAATPESGVLGR